MTRVTYLAECYTGAAGVAAREFSFGCSRAVQVNARQRHKGVLECSDLGAKDAALFTRHLAIMLVQKAKKDNSQHGARTHAPLLEGDEDL